MERGAEQHRAPPRYDTEDTCRLGRARARFDRIPEGTLMTRRIAALALVAGLAGGTLLAAAPASAGGHSHFSVGVGIGFPVVPCCGYYGYPYPYYRPYYYPPAYYYPSPGYYYPPPAYAPAATYPPAMVMQGSPPESPGWQPGQTYCREWQGKATINGQQQDLHGTVCRQPDGTWRFQN